MIPLLVDMYGDEAANSGVSGEPPRAQGGIVQDRGSVLTITQPQLSEAQELVVCRRGIL